MVNQEQELCSVCEKKLTFWKTSLQKIEGKKVCTKCAQAKAFKELKSSIKDIKNEIRPTYEATIDDDGNRQYRFGNYLYGLKEKKPRSGIWCVEKENDFLFKFGLDELGAIPINKIKSVRFEDRTQISSRFTATRMVTLGIFALAAKKKKTEPSFYLTIEWEERELLNSAIFEFPTLIYANAANSHVREKIGSLPEVVTSIESHPETSAINIPGQIEKLADLKEKGILTEEEFDIKKKELLNKM